MARIKIILNEQPGSLVENSLMLFCHPKSDPAQNLSPRPVLAAKIGPSTMISARIGPPRQCLAGKNGPILL